MTERITIDDLEKLFKDVATVQAYTYVRMSLGNTPVQGFHLAKWLHDHNKSNDLSKMDLTSLKGSFKGAILKGLHFEGADLSGLDLEGADLESVVFYNTNLKGANLRYANLSKAVIWRTELENANLEHCRFDGTSVLKSNLKRARGLAAIQLNEISPLDYPVFQALPSVSETGGKRQAA